MARRLESETRGNRPVAERKVNFRLRDWGISRQRYWGCPIPVIHCESAASCRCPTSELPVMLPEDVTFDLPGNPLDRHPTWKHVACPQCGSAGAARDRHDGHLRRFVLVLRALHRPDGSTDGPTDRDRRPLAAGRPVYRRHRARDPAPALFALLHARDERRPAMPTLDEPFEGCSRRAWWCTRPTAPRTAPGCCPADVRIEASGGERRAFHVDTGAPIEIGSIEKMSKSKRNTVDPDDIIATYGADTARWFMLSDSPPERDVIWTEEGVQGAHRFVQRVWRLVGDIAERARVRAAMAARRSADRRGDPQGGAPGPGRRRGGYRAAALQPLRRAYLRTGQRLQAALGSAADAAAEPGLAAAFSEAGRSSSSFSRR